MFTTTLTRWVVVSAAMFGCSGPASVAMDGDVDQGGDDDASIDDAGSDGALDDAGDAMIDTDASPGALATICDGVPTTPAQWEQCYVKRWCEVAVNCTELNAYSDVEECIQTSGYASGGQRDFDIAENIRAVSDGRATIDVARFTACLLETSPEQCNSGAQVAACRLRYKGAIADGQSCYADAECASPGASCTPTDCGDACCTGTCVRKKMLNETACSTTGVNACEPGLVCSLVQGKCIAGDVGTVCVRATDCDPENNCDQIGNSPGLCVADLPVGTSCKNILQCGGESGCVGLKRNVGTPTCRRITEVGDACDWFCLGSLYCDLSNPTGLGVCRTMPQLNQACSDFLPCTGIHNQCVNGTCQPRLASGASCANPALACDVGLFCTDQLGEANPTCRPLFADGELGCRRDSQCQSHLCSGTASSAGECRPALSSCP